MISLRQSRFWVVPALVLTAVGACDCEEEPLDDIICDFEVTALGGAEIDFGSVQVNSAPRESTFVIENKGNRQLTSIEVTFTANGEAYEVDVPDDLVVTPGDTEALIVAFQPTRTSVLNTEMRIGHPDLGADGCPLRTISLRGEGVAEPIVDAGTDAGPEDDGGFFVDGGLDDGGFVENPDGGVLLPPNAVWRAYGGFEEARAGFATVELLDGTLAVIGGYGENGKVLDSIERFDPVTGRSRIAARMAQPRAEPGAVMLGDGRIAIVGGRTQATGGVVVTTIEIYVPNAPPAADELLCPGTQATNDACTDNSLGFLPAPRINPIVTSLAGNLIAVAAGKTLDPDGFEVALAGGDVVDVAAGTATPISGIGARLDEARVVGPDGSFLLIGGRNAAGVPSIDVVRFDGLTRAAGVAVSLPASRAAAGAAVLTTGAVIVSGGTGGNGAPLGDALLINAAFDSTPTIQPLTITLEPRVSPVVVALPDDFVVIAGGLPEQVFGKDDDDSVVPLTSADVLVPFGAAFARLSTDNDLAQGRVGGAAVVTGPSGAGGAGDDVITFVGGYATQPRKTPHPHAEQFSFIENQFSSFGLMGSGTALTAAAIFEVSEAALVSVGGVDPHTGVTSSRVRAFDAIDGVFVDAAPLRAPRRDHTATSIAADLVVVIGGRDQNGNVLASASILDVDGQDLTLPVTLRRPRALHTATLLPDDAGLGDNAILLCGGVGAGGEPLDTCEVFKAPDNPRDAATFPTASFVLAGGRMSAPRVGHTATLFDSGEVIIIGGGDVELDQSAADIFIPDPADPRLVRTGVPVQARRDHAAINIGGGRVLVVGGDVFSGGVAPTRSAEVYSRNSESFTAVEDMEEPRSKPAAFLLLGGQVLVSGGTKSLGESGFPFISVIESELYDPGASGLGTFEAIEVPLSYGRSDLQAADIFGRAVVVGGTHRDGIIETGDERRTPQLFIDMLEEGAPGEAP